MAIEKYMDVSTCYITEQDDAKLGYSNPPIPVYEYEYGYFVHCSGFYGDTEQECREFGMSDDFINLMKYAYSQGCGFVKLDADGDDTLTFPKHDW